MCGAAEAAGKRNLLIDVFCAWHCHSHSVGPSMRGGSLRLHQDLKAPVREASEQRSPRHCCITSRLAGLLSAGPTVGKVKTGSSDKDSVCRRGDNDMLQWWEHERHRA